jgi:hypothetical protein
LGGYGCGFFALAGERSTPDCLELVLAYFKGGIFPAKDGVIEQAQTIFRPNVYLFTTQKGHEITVIPLLHEQSAFY